MSEYLKQTTEATEQYLSFLARTQEQILDGFKKTPVFAAPTAPSFPATSFPATSFPAMSFPAPADVPGFAVPTASPRELTEAALTFTEKLIGQQKSFMKQYFDITESKIKESETESKKKA